MGLDPMIQHVCSALAGVFLLPWNRLFMHRPYRIWLLLCFFLSCWCCTNGRGLFGREASTGGFARSRVVYTTFAEEEGRVGARAAHRTALFCAFAKQYTYPNNPSLQQTNNM
ncbi:hypothetical protein BC939DRAFT_433889, partial [Gamsiella multidivaricata]|uniref:uncharacterized protein n=1 Tax=Gamsiella multidivaricata TaxID=101098 RepID=UPI00221F478D